MTQTNPLQPFGISNHDHYTRVIKRYQPEAKTIDPIIEMADPATVN
ncbi:MAG: hypothetical protein WBY71_09765 [Nitrososphaeraceae archaeon]